MRGATSTLGALPCWAAVMRSVIGDSFLKAANATRPSLCFLASPSPCTKECSPATAMVPVTNPNERRSRACSPAQAPPTLAGRGRGPAQSSALAGNLEKRTPGPPGLPVPWPSLGGRQWPDSSVTAANWPPVPTSPWGRQPTPKGRAALAPRGDRSWRCSTAQLRVTGRPGGSGCATQGDARGPSSALRTVLTATDPRDQSTAEPPVH